jgi:hypothetical protein
MKIFILICFGTFLAFHSYAQGCSDAGFCTMGAMKPDQPYNKRLSLKLRTLEFSQYYGHTHFNNKIYVQTIEANFSLGDKYVVQVKVPYQTNHGHLGTFSSISDISLSLTKNVYSTDNFDVNLTLGTKLPGNNGDKQQIPDPTEAGNRLSLPMYYQTSLGTYDLVFGGSIVSRKWLFAAGYQQALNANKNGFWYGEWHNPSDSIYIHRYAQSTNLYRGKDIMARAERNFRLSRFNASIGLLGIWRVTQDVIDTPKGVQTPDELVKLKVPGSTGLALSGIYTVGYNFNVKSGLKLLIGNRFIQRQKNPDGLSREFVASLTYSYRF